MKNAVENEVGPGATLEAVFPNRASFGGRTVVVGPNGYALLRAVLAHKHGAKMDLLAAKVYGVEEVTRNRIETQIYRLNAKLEEVGCERRLAVDGGRVVLV
jgi:hypothetical protein